MREIKFRGKTFGNAWVYGNLIRQIKDDGIESCYIRPIKIDSKPVSIIHIDKNTIGQFTGLTDKNGKEIYEGDILEYEFEDIGKQKAYVYWNEKYAGFLLEVVSKNFEYTEIKKGKVIGNIYDNPKLIKE